MQVVPEGIPYGPSILDLVSDQRGSIPALAGFSYWLYSLARILGFHAQSGNPSVPSTDETNLPAPGKYFCYGVEHVVHNFTPFSPGCLFALLGLGLPKSSLPFKSDLSNPLKESLFTFFLSCPSQISLSNSFFSW